MRRSVLFAAVIAFASAVAFAQSKPDFSGTWIVVSPADEAGQVRQVQQTATTLTTGNASDTDGNAVVYRLVGGRGTRDQIQTSRETVPSVSTTRWKGSTLLITTETIRSGGRLESLQAWSLDPYGRLVIEYGQSLAGRQLLSQTLVYKKKD